MAEAATHPPSDPILSMDAVRFDRGGTPILNPISITLTAGELVVLVGRSGSGKSTLLRLAAGLLVPTAGTVGVAGPSGHTESEGFPGRAAGSVAFVRQQPDAQLIASTVVEEVAFGLGMHGLTGQALEDRVEECLTRFDLGRYRDQSPASLSGGMQQRLAIAAAWALRPRLWLLDEPTAHLDRPGRATVHQLVRQMRPDSAVLLATSDPEEMLLADRVLLLHNGRIERDGTPQEVLDSDEYRNSGMQPPRSTVLARWERLIDGREGHLPESGRPAAAAVPSRRSSLRTVISARAVSVRRRELFGPEHTVLHDVSVEVHEGERLALVGSSGAGKTTLLEALAGVIDRYAGTVEVAETETEPGCRRVALAFQFPERSFFAETVLEEVAYGPQNLGLNKPAARDRASEALQRVGYDPRRIGSRNPFSLSGGEARRVALAAVLALRPTVLLLDEPTAGLDAVDASRLDTLLRNESERGTAVIISGHDLDRLADLCDRWIVLQEGRVSHDGDPRELWTCDPPWLVDPPTTVRAWMKQGGDPRNMPGLGIADVLGDDRISR